LHTLRLLATHGFYALILILTTRIITDAGTIIVGAFVGVSAVTYYAIASSLTTYAYSVISCITTTIPPAASHLEAMGNEEGLKVLCIGGTKSVLMIGLPILITYILTGDLFLRLWVGEAFGQSYLPLALLSVAWAFNYLQVCALCALIGLSRHKVAAWMALVQSFLNVGLSIVLVKSMGMLGVAWGAMLASVVMNLIFQVHALRQLQIPIGRFVNQAVLPWAATMLPFTLVLGFLTVVYPPARLINYFAEVAVAVSCMMLFLPWLGLNSNERVMVRSSFGRWLKSAKFTPS
jgi:O-antigen/teichoic acid export membrane protein